MPFCLFLGKDGQREEHLKDLLDTPLPDIVRLRAPGGR